MHYTIVKQAKIPSSISGGDINAFGIISSVKTTPNQICSKQLKVDFYIMTKSLYKHRAKVQMQFLQSQHEYQTVLCSPISTVVLINKVSTRLSQLKIQKSAESQLQMCCLRVFERQK